MRIPRPSAFVGALLLTVVLSIAGFTLLELNLVPYGFTLFCVMPVLIGYSIGQYPGFNIIISIAAALGVVIFFYLLKIGGLESLFCILTLSPLLYFLLFVGMYIGYRVRNAIRQRNTHRKDRIQVVVAPILIVFLSGFIETFFTARYSDETVTTTVVLPYSKEAVFDHVKSFDTLQSPKPFLFHIGIQTPLKCVLQNDEVGARRICYFKEGTIDEVVTDFQRGTILGMKITAYNMPGRKWLHFQDAIYRFNETAAGTELTRITTFKTELKPRFYWRYWEHKAIEAEHEYVLADLRRRLDSQPQPEISRSNTH
jgi:hypothetical protein